MDIAERMTDKHDVFSVVSRVGGLQFISYLLNAIFNKRCVYQRKYTNPLMFSMQENIKVCMFTMLNIVFIGSTQDPRKCNQFQ